MTPVGHLHGEVPDRAGPAGHQHRRTSHRPVGEQAAVRGDGRHAQAGGQLLGHPGGQRHRVPAGSTVHSAAVPQRRPNAASQTHTGWPTRSAGTPGPTASITPAPS